jgi:hypothetical protein
MTGIRSNGINKSQFRRFHVLARFLAPSPVSFIPSSAEIMSTTLLITNLKEKALLLTNFLQSSRRGAEAAGRW